MQGHCSEASLTLIRSERALSDLPTGRRHRGDADTEATWPTDLRAGSPLCPRCRGECGCPPCGAAGEAPPGAGSAALAETVEVPTRRQAPFGMCRPCCSYPESGAIAKPPFSWRKLLVAAVTSAESASATLISLAAATASDPPRFQWQSEPSDAVHWLATTSPDATPTRTLCGQHRTDADG